MTKITLEEDECEIVDVESSGTSPKYSSSMDPQLISVCNNRSVSSFAITTSSFFICKGAFEIEILAIAS